MKNKELIAKLQEFNPEADIHLDTFSAEAGGTGDVSKVVSVSKGSIVVIQEGRVKK